MNTTPPPTANEQLVASFKTIEIPDAYHKSYMERNSIRDTAVSNTIDFFKSF